MALEYCKRAWDSETGSWASVKVSDMSVDDAEYWEANVQPEIRRIAQLELSEGRPLTRSDYRWPWHQMRRALPVAQAMVGRRCRFLTIFLQDASGNAVPAAMLALIERYPWPLQRAKRFRFRFGFVNESTFTWFLSSAPRSALRGLGITKTPSLIRVLIDTALVTSVTLELRGRMWLHAAPAGGDRLLETYLKKCKLRRVKLGTRIPKLPRPFTGVLSDGRHFYATSRLARVLIDELKGYREE